MDLKMKNLQKYELLKSNIKVYEPKQRENHLVKEFIDDLKKYRNTI